MNSYVNPEMVHQFGAFLRADVRLVGPGYGSQANVIFQGGLTRRVRVSRHLLRLGTALRGRHQVELSLRTTLQGQLMTGLQLIELTRNATPIEHPSRTAWSAVGLVADLGTTVLIFRSRRALPIRISFQPGPGVKLNTEVGRPLSVQGTLRGDCLIATAVNYDLTLKMPPHWEPFSRSRGR